MAKGKNKVLRIILLTAVSFALSAGIVFSGILNTFELKAYDLLSRNLNPAEPPDDIVIIKVDQQSIDALNAEGIRWPWPRQMYAPLVDYLSEADAVFIDILFTEPSSYGEEDDLVLSKAIKKASNVYLPVFLTNREKDLSEKDMEFLEKISVKGKVPAAMAFNSVVTPIDALKFSVRGAGNVTIPPDEDGVYRRVPLIFNSGEYTIPHFILSYLINEGRITIKDGSIYIDGSKIPLREQALMLRYFRKTSPFPAISAVEVLRSYLENSLSGNPSVKKEYFRGKKVFIGLTAAGLYDLKPTAVSSISTGVVIHATTLENIINKTFIKPINNIYTVVFMFLICFLINFSVIRYHSVYANLSVFLILFLIAVSIPALLFKNALYMGIVSPSVSLVVGFIISAAYSYATEGKERRFIKKTFSRYMDKKIVEHILKNPVLIKPGGQRKHITVFFADIAGFTTIAEKVPAEETAKILHTILNSFTEVIIRNSGVIDKYIGDCIMAFWGAPVADEKDEINACRCALQCMEALEEINRAFRAEGLSEIAVRIGIHSGDAIVGNLGSDRLFDYTAVGDTVNLASRLESANKLFNTQIIISEETLKKTDDMFFTRQLGMLEVKGKNIPVRIFELIAEKDKIRHNKKELVAMFNQGMAFFNEQNFEKALGIFNSILEKFPDDRPAKFYKDKCEQLIATLQQTDWNIIKMREK
jgi:adenylate cyclase